MGCLLLAAVEGSFPSVGLSGAVGQLAGVTRVSQHAWPSCFPLGSAARFVTETFPFGFMH